MAERRQNSRFRLPWLKSTPDPRPARSQPPAPAPPSRPAERQIGTTQPTTTTPAQRPPSRRPGVASPQAPPPTQAATTQSRRSRVNPQPVSPPPSRASTQSQGTSQTPPPSPVATESRSSVQPPSPSRAPPQPQAETQQALQEAPQPQSPPPKLASEPSVQTSSLPPSSPSLTATQAQSEPGEAVTRPLLPSTNLQPMTQSPLTFQPSFTEQPSSVSEDEPKPAMSEPESEELQLKAETASQNVLNARSQITFQPNEMPGQPSEASEGQTSPTPTSTSGADTLVLTQKSDSSLVNAETKSTEEPGGHPGEITEGKEIRQVHGSEEKINGVTEILTAAPGSEVPNQMHPSVAFDAEQTQLEEDEVIGEKETISNSSNHRKEDPTVILNLKDKTTVSESGHKPNTSDAEKVPLHKEIRGNISKLVHKAQEKHPLNERPVSVITLAGENRGASMQLGSESARREGTVHIRRGYKINPDESTINTDESTTDGESNSNGRRSQDLKNGEDQESKAYINSNVQGVNNSVMLSSSIIHRDPGVQLFLSHNLTEPSKPNESTESLETRKAEVNVTPAQTLTYEPTVRRRCLRGLFMEPSDSDPNDPEKPRRHGCHYGRKEKSKDDEIDVL